MEPPKDLSDWVLLKLTRHWKLQKLTTNDVEDELNAISWPLLNWIKGVEENDKRWKVVKGIIASFYIIGSFLMAINLVFYTKSLVDFFELGMFFLMK